MIDPIDVRVTSYLPQSGHGAGGMTVGLTTSGIIAHHIPTGVGVSCDSERSQYANKERALQLLESLVIAIESERHFSATVIPTLEQAKEALWASDFPPPTPYVAGKVQMIKDVRQAAGCGLKEAKEAVDKMGTFEGALLHIRGSTGYCTNGMDACVCGGDLPSIREGCHNWKL